MNEKKFLWKAGTNLLVRWDSYKKKRRRKRTGEKKREEREKSREGGGERQEKNQNKVKPWARRRVTRPQGDNNLSRA